MGHERHGAKQPNRFDPARGTAFGAFAIPTILGELKRYFRDSAWAVHVTRAAQERALAVEEASDELINEIRSQVADRIGKFARPKRIIWADDLPKTRSGKIMRRLLRDIAEGRALGDVTTLRDPDVMSQLEGKINEERAHAEA